MLSSEAVHVTRSDYDLSEEEEAVLKDLKSRPDNFEEDYDNQPFGD